MRTSFTSRMILSKQFAQPFEGFGKFVLKKTILKERYPVGWKKLEVAYTDDADAEPRRDARGIRDNGNPLARAK